MSLTKRGVYWPDTCYVNHKTGESDHMNAHIWTERCGRHHKRKTRDIRTLTTKEIRQEVSETPRDKKNLEMIEKGKQLAPFFGKWRVLGVDPGYLFVRTDGRGSIDLPADVVDTLLGHLGKGQ